MEVTYTELNKYKEAAIHCERFSPINIAGLNVFNSYVEDGIIPTGDKYFDKRLSDAEFELLSYFDFTFGSDLSVEIYTNIGNLIDKEKISVYLTMAILNTEIHSFRVYQALNIDKIRNSKIPFKSIDENEQPLFVDSLSYYLFWCDYAYASYVEVIERLKSMLDYHQDRKPLIEVKTAALNVDKPVKLSRFEDMFTKEYKDNYMLFFDVLKEPGISLISDSNVWIGNQTDSYTYFKILLAKDIIQEKNVAQAARMFADKFKVNRHNFQSGPKSKPSLEKIELFTSTIEQVLTDIKFSLNS